ncbi:nucleoside phosphorylase [Saccharomonospora amisosensis]|uniref:Nucleoside phosphorylase n=1 Tax=Saccharomonospora amisosensis TaxID=1128677 RepID=A0A7X5ZR71_9PSEU|nr:5'-methylthioadenosine/S-adenosylhomocysteine nucleosidase [Saccharomonospora amisosensis]NIJ12579.1 nucleoside phosphorylase [Saccharomonospora amisosensis]
MARDLVVILTALNLEYDAVRRRLHNPNVYRHRHGTRYEIGELPGVAGRLALALTGKGNPAAGVLAERAVQEFSPAALLFVGVAGALWDTPPLGDVVMATHVYAYHGGTSENDGLKARPRVWETDHGLIQLAAHLARKSEWSDHKPRQRTSAKVHFGSIAAGEIVQNSRVSREAVWIRNHYNDALAIEMEGAGVAQAGHLSGSAVAIVRGISDRADGTKNTDDDRNWQPRAADNAAAFAIGLVTELLNDQGKANMKQSDESDYGVRVSAAGTVGIQAGGNVSGSNVWITGHQHDSPSIDLVADLAALRDRLDLERSTGKLDEDTYAAARTELDTAREAIAAETPDNKSTFVLALKRLRGLLADAAELTTKIATILAAVKGLQ